jgi:hypothetical protein
MLPISVTADTGDSSVSGISSGGAVNGISSGGVVDGISSGGVVDGISSGGVVDGISSGGVVDGISSGGVVDGISSGGISHVLSAPVDSIDAINGLFEAAGQKIMASQEMLSGLSVGDFVSVDGSVVAPGWLYADTLSVSTDTYIPGVHEVYVEGMPNSVDASVGQMKVGNLLIDFNAVLSNGPIPTGHSFSFRGIQPVSQGVLLTDSVKVVQ